MSVEVSVCCCPKLILKEEGRKGKGEGGGKEEGGRVGRGKGRKEQKETHDTIPPIFEVMSLIPMV